MHMYIDLQEMKSIYTFICFRQSFVDLFHFQLLLCITGSIIKSPQSGVTVMFSVRFRRRNNFASHVKTVWAKS